ncbi:hypothetical protein KKG71_02200, partial [Patescibacteria group bacterium]|nr:hypothetical protein [Patescibacteria group bacterium]
SDLLKFIVRNACERNGINFPKQNEIDTTNRKPVNVLFGGNTSERQVSLMSGTNAWLKLKNSKKYEAHPYLLDLNNNSVWRLPYSKTLNHTVEEISEMCREAPAAEERLAPLRRRVLEKIACEPGHLNEELFIPEKMTLNEFIARSDFVFIGLHGGIGENGVLQKMLEDAKKPFNGSGSTASRLCIDKYATSKKLANLDKEGIHIPKKQLVGLKEVFKFSEESIKKLWKELKRQLTSSSIIVKPRADGCSTGIVRLYTARDLVTYVDLIKRGVASISPSTFQNQPEMIEMPAEKLRELMFEQFIQTDKVRVIKNKLKWEKISGWVEITMGVIGKGTKIKALNPSLTVATSDILSLEEKFQGGTGVNITPPPEPYIKKKAVEKARKRMEIVAKKLGISGYARIDAFMECDTGELLIIEANTTPALTPSTVIYHQALSENPPIYPTELMERIIELA